VVKQEGIGVGNELYFPGLFSPAAGSTRNLPIVRFGNIAAMPGEKIASTELGSIEAYLIEARSIGGLSGSPVFVTFGHVRVVGSDSQITGGYPVSFLLGLIHGHFGIADIDADADSADALAPRKPSVNMGIGMVVPARDIISTLNEPALVAEREEMRKRREAEDLRNLQTELD
jgi:hypothetical protein